MKESGGQFFLERDDKARSAEYLTAHRRLSYHGVQIGGVDWLIRQEVEVGLHLLSFDGQHLEGDPDMRRLHGDQDGRPVTLKQTSCFSCRGVVLGCHEYRATLRVGQQVLSCLRVQKEVIAGSPVEYFLPTAFDHRKIECFNLHL